jgi:hypothetical protein
VKESIWAKNFRQLGIPIIEISDWGDILSDDFLSVTPGAGFNPTDFEALWADYWIQQIKKYV